jgi:enediyne biosynthesis protein E8
VSLALSRRRLLQLSAAAAAAWVARPLLPAAAQTPIDDAVAVPTMEAFADTLIPGEKRHPGDRAIAGAAEGPGLVQAGAIDLMYSEAGSLGPFVPALATALNTEATGFAAQRGLVLDPTVAPFVALDFAQRTELLVELVDRPSPLGLLWFAIGALAWLAYHTAGHLPTAQAIADGHPGLAAIGFPEPDPDGLWRFDAPSYRRVLAQPNRATASRGHPA